jgi:hypothetical protein
VPLPIVSTYEASNIGPAPTAPNDGDICFEVKHNYWFKKCRVSVTRTLTMSSNN